MTDRKLLNNSKDDDSPFVINEVFSEEDDGEEETTDRDEHNGSRLRNDQAHQGTWRDQRQDSPTHQPEFFSQDTPTNSLDINVGIPADSLSPTIRIGNGQSNAPDQQRELLREKDADPEKKLAKEDNKDFFTAGAVNAEPHSGDEIPILNRQASTISGVSFFSDLSSLTTTTIQTPPAPELHRATNLRITSPGAFSVEGTVAGTADLLDDDSTVASSHDGETSNTSTPGRHRPDPPSAPATTQLLQAEIVDDSAQREQMEELIEINRALAAQLQALGGAAVRVSSRGSSVGHGLLPIAEAQQVTLLQDDVENNVLLLVANSAGQSQHVRRGREQALSRGESLKEMFSRPRNRWLSIGLLAAVIVVVVGAVLSKISSSNDNDLPLEDDVVKFANETGTAIPTTPDVSATLAPTINEPNDISASKTPSPSSGESAQDDPTVMPVGEQPPLEDKPTVHPTVDQTFPDTPVIYNSKKPTLAPTSSKVVPDMAPVSTPVPTGLVTVSPTSVSGGAVRTNVPTKAPTLKPTAPPTPRPTIGIRPITSAQELRSAVDVYLSNSRSDSVAAKMYGWPIGTWDVSQVEDFSGLFSLHRNHQVGKFNENIGDWDVSRATDMSEMFSGATSFNQNLNRWDTAKVRDMSRMFSDASSFNGVISSWDTRKVTTMQRMFANAKSFEGDISKWTVTSVTVLMGMFNGASSFNSNISKWSINRASALENMFSGASSFRQDLCRWGSSISKRANVDEMFESTRCEDSSDPNLVRNIPGPFCAVCSDPTEFPTISPTMSPTTRSPTLSPTTTESPTLSPTTIAPTRSPSTIVPTLSPSTSAPTLAPTEKPTTGATPTKPPENAATPPATTDPKNNIGGIVESVQPVITATIKPTSKPARSPTYNPTSRPTEALREEPTKKPTANPTPAPTISPTQSPTEEPSEAPTRELDNP